MFNLKDGFPQVLNETVIELPAIIQTDISSRLCTRHIEDLSFMELIVLM